ncbi:restriction endonuclease, partial [Methanobrevibacter sp. OttesenSCG-928-I08]|nr:restriction endonuclease [Methanobrevibacter sp. OttesenSCG-928-I08]
EESGFKVYKNFKTSQRIIDIYAVLPTTMGDFGMVMECNNYDKQWEVGVDILKDMEQVGKSLNSSKVSVVTTSNFSSQAKNYASKKNIKLVDRDDLLSLAKKFSNKQSKQEVLVPQNDNYIENEIYGENEYYYEDNNQNEYYYQNDLQDRSYGYDDNFSSSSPSLYSSDYINNHLNDNQNKGFFNNILSKKKSSQNNYLHTPIPYREEISFLEKIKPFLSNTIVLILIVVAISYFIAYLLGVLGGVSAGITGLVEMIISLLLSYGLVLIFNRDGVSVLVKGTIVFFISLIILIALILII